MTQILLKGALTLDSKINTTRAQQRERERERERVLKLKKAIEGELRGLKIGIFLDKNPGRHLQEGRDSNAYYTHILLRVSKLTQQDLSRERVYGPAEEDC
jgi:hypothetical protein